MHSWSCYTSYVLQEFARLNHADFTKALREFRLWVLHWKRNSLRLTAQDAQVFAQFAPLKNIILHTRPVRPGRLPVLKSWSCFEAV